NCAVPVDTPTLRTQRARRRRKRAAPAAGTGAAAEVTPFSQTEFPAHTPSRAASRELERAEDAGTVAEGGGDHVVGEVAGKLTCADVAREQAAHLLPHERH